MIKKITAALLVFFISAAAFAQVPPNDTTAPYYKNPNLPLFKMYNLDSVAFTQSVLVKHKKTIVMMFNPECGHCQKEIDILLSIPQVTQNTQIILVSTEPLAKIKEFYFKNHLERFPYIFAGKDIKYFWGRFFKPSTIPVLAFYNEQDQFITLHQGNMDKAEVIAALQ